MDRILTTPLNDYINILNHRDLTESARIHTVGLDLYDQTILPLNPLVEEYVRQTAIENYSQDRLVIVFGKHNALEGFTHNLLLLRKVNICTDVEFDEWIYNVLSRFSSDYEISNLTLWEKEQVCTFWLWSYLCLLSEKDIVIDPYLEGIVNYIYKDKTCLFAFQKICHIPYFVSATDASRLMSSP